MRSIPLGVPARWRAWRPALTSTRLAVVAGVFFALTANTAFLSAALAGRDHSTAASWLFALSLVATLAALHVLLLSVVLVRPLARPLLGVLIAITAFATYYMQRFGVYLDPTMLRNVLGTDPAEAGELFGWSMLPHLLVFGVLPLLVLWRVRVVRQPLGRALALRLATMVGATLVLIAAMLPVFQDFSALMRNHKAMRYLITPGNLVYSTARALGDGANEAQQVRTPVGTDARLDTSWATRTKPTLLVLAVGETARSASWGLNGYSRQTTPELAARDVINFPDVKACGTNTETSLPCMFAAVGRRDYDERRIRTSESLLHVLHRAGFQVLWRDNQSGCKGVCDRVPHADTRNLNLPDICPEGECFDEAMLRALPDELARLDPERRARGTVVVMHQMGSHGPAYYKRSPPAMKLFQPECTSHALQECPPEQIQNAYDNSLRNTDHLLAETVRWLQTQQRPTALVYVSDHGESLGEKGLYLHGMPYRMAPTEQTHVPMLTWASKPLQQAQGLRLDCLRAQAAQPWSHDNLFHTMLGLARVGTTARDGSLDMLAPCTAPS